MFESEQKSLLLDNFGPHVTLPVIGCQADGRF
jgi:hypothetical protein